MQISPGSTWSIVFSVRRDLRLQAVEPTGENSSFNILDPLTRQSYRIGDVERRILQLLNGRRPLKQVFGLLRNMAASGGLQVTESDFLAITEQFRKSGLILATRSRQSSHYAQGLQSAFTRVQSLVASFVVWQIRGLQPDKWLSKIAPHTDSIFSSVSVRVWLITAAVTFVAVLLEFPRLLDQSGAWDWVIHPLQGSALFVVFLFTRALHELGHAIACKRQGVRCPDIGVFVILGAPCVYCDVSESWHLSNRWQRAAVAAAGMYVEIIVATLAAWIWILTVDSPLNTIALQTMFVCSISTILINANPLMRFDGYYLLSDLVDHPNLRDKADKIAVARIYRFVLGKKGVDTKRLTVADHLLSIFSWSSWIYRAGLSLIIAGVLATIYASWHLAWIGRIVGVSILISWWGVPTMKFASDIARVARRTQTRLRLALVTSLLVIGIALVPIPYRQFARGWVQPLRMQGVYVSTAGRITESLAYSGAMVANETPLFKLDNSMINSVLVKRAGELERARVEKAAYEVESLVTTAVRDTSAHATAVDNAERELREAEEEQQRLTLKSPCAGRLMILPVSRPPGVSEVDSQPIEYGWDDLTQRQRYVTEGTMLAAVCSSQQVALLPLDDEQLQWIAEGTEVRLHCPGRAPKVIQCSVSQIGDLTDETATWRLINMHATNSTLADQSRPSGVSPNAARVARIVLPEGEEFPAGTTIEAAFVAPSQTIASIGYRWLQKNLRWLAD